MFIFSAVGAGSAGAVLANRLSENPNVTVLLLEAGGDPTPQSDIPFYAGSLALTEMDWLYQIEPQNHSCLGLINKVRYKLYFCLILLAILII